jgi:hypothetical protein
MHPLRLSWLRTGSRLKLQLQGSPHRAVKHYTTLANGQEMFCLIRITKYSGISPHSGTKSSSKRDESCIAFSGLIPDSLLHPRIDLLKIGLIVKWYSPVKAHQRCIYTANREAIQIALNCACEMTLPKNILISIFSGQIIFRNQVQGIFRELS